VCGNSSYSARKLIWTFGAYNQTGVAFGLSSAFVTIYFWIDSLMLSLIQGNQAVGFYNADIDWSLAYCLFLQFLVLLFFRRCHDLHLFAGFSAAHVERISEVHVNFKYPDSSRHDTSGWKSCRTHIWRRLRAFSGRFASTNMVTGLYFANATFVRLFESANMQTVVTKITGLMVIVNVAINLVLIQNSAMLEQVSLS